jgi:hypothetical protein
VEVGQVAARVLVRDTKDRAGAVLGGDGLSPEPWHGRILGLCDRA